MPDCHKCQHNGLASQLCITCKGPSETPHNHGQTHVSVEQVAGFVPAPAPEPETDAAFETALHAMRTFAAFGLIEREIICGRLVGQELPAILARLKATTGKTVTSQAVHARLKKVVMSHPSLNVLFRGMVAKQEKRKGKTK